MSELVFSTGSGKVKKNKQKNGKKAYSQSKGPAKIRLESKGRGGKMVTIVFNLPMSEFDARTRMKELQTILGCGGTLKESMIIFQGDVREKVKKFFEDNSEKIILAGG